MVGQVKRTTINGGSGRNELARGRRKKGEKRIGERERERREKVF